MMASIKNAVKRINDVTYIVNSQSGSSSYTINLNKIGFICSCPDHQYRGVKCKHIHAVEFSSAIREQVKSDIIITPIDSLSCRYCNSKHSQESYDITRMETFKDIFVKNVGNDSHLILALIKCMLHLR